MTRSVAFAAWLSSELERREMRQADLARRLATSNSTISEWINGSRIPSSESCAKVAAVVGIPIDEVLMVAGHRPRASDEWDKDVREVANIMNTLGHQHKEEIREFARFRWERVQQRGRQRES